MQLSKYRRTAVEILFYAVREVHIGIIASREISLTLLFYILFFVSYQEHLENMLFVIFNFNSVYIK